jgi:hypothetical protein
MRYFFYVIQIIPLLIIKYNSKFYNKFYQYQNNLKHADISSNKQIIGDQFVKNSSGKNWST